MPDFTAFLSCITTSPPPSSPLLWSDTDLSGKEEKTSEGHCIPLPPPSDHPQNSTALVHPEGHQDRARTAALAGSGHLSVLLRCCKCSAAPAAAFLFPPLEVALVENLQGKVKILLPLTHRIYVPEQHWSLVHYWKERWFRIRWSKRTQLKASRNNETQHQIKHQF